MAAVPSAAIRANAMNRVPHFASRPQLFARVVLAVVLTGLGMWTLRGFLPALVWAGVLAIAVWPLYQWAHRRWPPGRHNLVLPIVFTVSVALVFIVPLAFVAVQVATEASSVFNWLDDVRKSGIPPPAWLHRLPFGESQALTWWQENLADPTGAGELLRRTNRSDLMLTGRTVGAELTHRVIIFGFTLMTLFFLFRDGARLAEQMRRASQRAFGAGGERVGRQIIASVHGTVDGLVLVGLGEGLVLGVTYALAGVSHPTLFGAITVVAAMVPFGAPVVFGAAALLLLARGAMEAAIAVVVTGAVITFVADHFIRPVLIGGATRLPFLWVLLGILGGVESWGLLGLFLGPAIMAALMLLWREWTTEDHRSEDHALKEPVIREPVIREPVIREPAIREPGHG
jgi:predicted PurR-regulated permease PerM